MQGIAESPLAFPHTEETSCLWYLRGADTVAYYRIAITELPVWRIREALPLSAVDDNAKALMVCIDPQGRDFVGHIHDVSEVQAQLVANGFCLFDPLTF